MNPLSQHGYGGNILCRALSKMNCSLVPTFKHVQSPWKTTTNHYESLLLGLCYCVITISYSRLLGTETLLMYQGISSDCCGLKYLIAAYKGYISLMNWIIYPDCHLLFVINLADWGSLRNGIRYIILNVYIYIFWWYLIKKPIGDHLII